MSHRPLVADANTGGGRKRPEPLVPTVNLFTVVAKSNLLRTRNCPDVESLNREQVASENHDPPSSMCTSLFPSATHAWYFFAQVEFELMIASVLLQPWEIGRAEVPFLVHTSGNPSGKAPMCLSPDCFALSGQSVPMQQTWSLWEQMWPVVTSAAWWVECA